MSNLEMPDEGQTTMLGIAISAIAALALALTNRSRGRAAFAEAAQESSPELAAALRAKGEKELRAAKWWFAMVGFCGAALVVFAFIFATR